MIVHKLRQPDTPEGDEMDLLVTLIEAWEDRHLAIEAPDPVVASHFRREQMRPY